MNNVYQVKKTTHHHHIRLTGRILHQFQGQDQGQGQGQDQIKLRRRAAPPQLQTVTALTLLLILALILGPPSPYLLLKNMFTNMGIIAFSMLYIGLHLVLTCHFKPF